MEIRKAVLVDLDGIARLYDAACDHLEAHENYPGWAKGVYPTRAMQRRDCARMRCMRLWSERESWAAFSCGTDRRRGMRMSVG